MIKGKTINSLMKHLRNKHGIDIHGSKQKTKLLNMGYYHGFKGYRFIGNSKNQIKYTDFEELVGVYEFDIRIKTILYPIIMFIETALKNYTLDTLTRFGPVDFDYIFSDLLNDYENENVGNNKYRNKMKNKLEVRNKFYQAISYSYSDQKDVVSHFFHNGKPIPLWAVFEVISMGEFGLFINCLNKNVRIAIARDLKVHSTSHNQNGRIVEDTIFLIKEIRNAVAHNSVIFDCRFKKANPQSRLKEYLHSETKISNIEFKTIIDYFIILIFMLKKLGVNKTELKKTIRNFFAESEELRKKVPVSTHTSIVGSDFRSKIYALTEYI